jgi:hypothetical protein
MQDNKFWRFVAVALIGALLYVGHGLHSGHDALPSLVDTVQASGAGVGALGGNHLIFTSSQDGHILYCWRFDGVDHARFLGVAKLDGKFVPGPPRVGEPGDGP